MLKEKTRRSCARKPRWCRVCCWKAEQHLALHGRQRLRFPRRTLVVPATCCPGRHSSCLRSNRRDRACSQEQCPCRSPAATSTLAADPSADRYSDRSCHESHNALAQHPVEIRRGGLRFRPKSSRGYRKPLRVIVGGLSLSIQRATPCLPRLGGSRFGGQDSRCKTDKHAVTTPTTRKVEQFMAESLPTIPRTPRPLYAAGRRRASLRRWIAGMLWPHCLRRLAAQPAYLISFSPVG